MLASALKKLYTIDDIYALPDNKRAELIDGQLYMMAPPSRMHQTIAREPFFAPFAVFLNEDHTDYVEPYSSLQL